MGNYLLILSILWPFPYKEYNIYKYIAIYANSYSADILRGDVTFVWSM